MIRVIYRMICLFVWDMEGVTFSSCQKKNYVISECEIFPECAVFSFDMCKTASLSGTSLYIVDERQFAV